MVQIMRAGAVALLGWILAGCAADKDGEVVPLKRRSMAERFGGGKRYKQDDKGNWAPEVASTKLAEAGKKSAYFTGESNLPKAYQAGDYTKQTWWGGKEYQRKRYEGNLDGSRFQTTARDQGKAPREAGKAADVPRNYQTGTYGTSAAREAQRNGITKTADSETENRREYDSDPEIIGWKQQRAMGMEEVKRRTGRN